MREIKFRAWDKKNKDYLLVLCTEDLFSDVEESPDRYVVQQYIGRKDRNKKEIYEGDIVKFNHYLEHGNSGKNVGEVMWNNGESTWFIYDGASEIGFGTKEGLYLGWARLITIIGNKFEDKELLT